jgi:hypothetical protein
MKIKIILLLLLILFFVIRFPARRILASPLSNGKYITVFRPFQPSWKNEYYIIPDKYQGIFRPANNYFILTPFNSDQRMTVDWSSSKYSLVIQLPYCESVQKVIYNIDTTTYYIATYCGGRFIDDSSSEESNTKKFSYYSISEWLP